MELKHKLLAALTVVCLAVAGCARGPKRSVTDAEALRRANARLAASADRPRTDAEIAAERQAVATYARNMLARRFGVGELQRDGDTVRGRASQQFRRLTREQKQEAARGAQIWGQDQPGPGEV